MSIAYKENGVWKTVSGIPPIDGALSSTSENPVQNKIVKQAVDGKTSGPSSAVANRVATFDGATGKLIKDSGYIAGKQLTNEILDDVITPGVYYANSENTVSNKPSVAVDGFSLTVSKVGNHLSQTVISVSNSDNNKIYRRYKKNSSSWSTWTEYFDERYYTKAEENQIIDGIQTKLSKTEDLISIVENGNACTHTGGISRGQYVNWKGNLYTADSNISVGATFASSGGSKNLTAVTDGGLNKLANQYLGSFTVSGLESYLLTMLTNMSYDEKKYVSFIISPPSGVFRNAVYQGIFTKTNNAKYEIIVWADDKIEYIAGAYYGNVMHWDKMAKDSDCAKMAYIEPTFTNGLATYNMASILSNYGYSSLTLAVAQVEGSGYTTGVYIAKSSISQNTNIKLTLATTSYSGVTGVTVIFKGN